MEFLAAFALKLGFAAFVLAVVGFLSRFVSSRPKTYAAVRVVNGRMPGLSDAWERKGVTFQRGRMRYRLWYLRAIYVTATAVRPVSETVLRVETEDAALELALPSDWMQQVPRWLGHGAGGSGKSGSDGDTKA
jgi:hypothetical protein